MLLLHNHSGGRFFSCFFQPSFDYVYSSAFKWMNIITLVVFAKQQSGIIRKQLSWFRRRTAHKNGAQWVGMKLSIEYYHRNVNLGDEFDLLWCCIVTTSFTWPAPHQTDWKKVFSKSVIVIVYIMSWQWPLAFAIITFIITTVLCVPKCHSPGLSYITHNKAEPHRMCGLTQWIRLLLVVVLLFGTFIISMLSIHELLAFISDSKDEHAFIDSRMH